MANSNQKYYSLSIASLIFSLLFFIPFFSIAGIITGIVSLSKISKDKKLKGRGLAIAGIIVGIIVLLIQILLVVLFYSLFSGFFAIAGKSPQESINYCIEEKSGISKDMCIIMAISLNINNTESINPNVCDEQINTEDIKNLCNAILKKDKEYCAKIIETESRMKCFGMLEELERKQ